MPLRAEMSKCVPVLAKCAHTQSLTQHGHTLAVRIDTETHSHRHKPHDKASVTNRDNMSYSDVASHRDSDQTEASLQNKPTRLVNFEDSQQTK